MSCSHCQDRGYYGGRMNGQYAGPWKWCSCAAASELRERQPELMDQANRAREKLLKISTTQRVARIARVTVPTPIEDLAEDYHGEW